jgi:hypothetical protein
MAVLVDSNVLLDILTEDARWFDRSDSALEQAAQRAALVINPIVYAEISVRFSRIEDFEEALPRDMLARENIPYEAAFLAAKVHMGYRRRGGSRHTPLPDFFIGAHAAVAGHQLLTRDRARYMRDFPSVIAP